MAHDEGLAERLREVYASEFEAIEKKMFGGIVFMVNGHMSCGVTETELMVRVGPEQYPDALKQPHAKEMTFTGRPLKGFVFVEPAGYEADKDLHQWVRRSLRFVLSLPPKS